MRPNDATDTIMKLTRYNYTAWKEEIEDRCLMKNRTDESVKIAFLRAGLNITQKNQLRRAMQEELDKPSAERTKYDDASPKSKPYTWALGYIREVIVKYGLDGKKARVEARKIENELATLSIAQFGYNLQSFHNRFHSIVERMAAMGYEVEQDVLVMYYQDGCRAHKTLELLTLTEDNDDTTYDDLLQKYQLAIEKMARRKGGSGARTNADRIKDGRAKATNSKGTCSHCGKQGHTQDKCWTKHPDQLPDWVKKTKEDTE
jgi:hypothetical protein